MQPTMNQPDTKCVLAIFVAASSTLCVAACPENHFQVQKMLCCLNCQYGEYVARNCSEGPRGHIGVLCNTCRRCEEIGEVTVSNCTQFSDTQCASIHTQQITMHGCSSVIAAVVILGVILAACFFRRISKSGESDGGSAGEPFPISV
ncbi:CD27 antigen-like isoform X2 [Cyprinus carpio]|uniref:CD27 antigen-like isoform X2 n=1 Tax=Cyprinus carpio TaxID=7962 RepID=A0A9Q9V2H7_CYPCA|nr:CD27 antigen-like isoform X2 [Cyprinus carpio]